MADFLTRTWAIMNLHANFIYYRHFGQMCRCDEIDFIPSPSLTMTFFILFFSSVQYETL